MTKIVPKKQFIVYDGRACGGQSTEDAIIYFVADSLKEAKKDAKDFGQCAIYSYDIDDKNLINEQWICDVFPKK